MIDINNYDNITIYSKIMAKEYKKLWIKIPPYSHYVNAILIMCDVKEKFRSIIKINFSKVEGKA